MAARRCSDPHGASTEARVQKNTCVYYTHTVVDDSPGSWVGHRNNVAWGKAEHGAGGTRSGQVRLTPTHFPRSIDCDSDTGGRGAKIA